jgi:hypothetical protein
MRETLLAPRGRFRRYIRWYISGRLRGADIIGDLITLRFDADPRATGYGLICRHQDPFVQSHPQREQRTK